MDKQQIDEFLASDDTGYLLNADTYQVIGHYPHGMYGFGGDSEFNKVATDRSDPDELFAAVVDDPYLVLFDDYYMEPRRALGDTSSLTAQEVVSELAQGAWEPLTRENVMRAWLMRNKDEVKNLTGLTDDGVVANRLNVPCRFGTLTAFPQGDTGSFDGIEVDLVDAHGTLHQVSLAESVSAGELGEGETGLHTFAWDGAGESPATETWCDPEGEAWFALGAAEFAEVRDTRTLQDVVEDAITEVQRHTIAWVDTDDVDAHFAESGIELTDIEKTLVVRDACDNLSQSPALWDLINDQIDVEGKARIRDRYGLNDLSFEQGTRLLEAVGEGRIEGACDMDPLTIALARNSYFRDALLTEIAAHSDPDQLRMVVSEITGRNPHDVPSTTETFAALDKAATETAAAKQTKDSLAAQSTHNKETHR